jgi:hypothetical protein
MKMRRTLMMAGAVVLAGVAWGVAGDDDVTFVNAASQKMIVVVRTGSSGEAGTCAAKPNRSVFELAVGAKNVVPAGGKSVCYCSVPEKDGAPKADSACSWTGAPPGTTVEIR